MSAAVLVNITLMVRLQFPLSDALVATDVLRRQGGAVMRGLCPAGYYCPDGTAIPCPVGTYRPVEGGVYLSDCWACAAWQPCMTPGFQQLSQKLHPTVTPLPPP